MSYITYQSKTVRCPKWNIDVHIKGKYRYTDNPDNVLEARLMVTFCEIMENGKLPLNKQKPELKLMRCNNSNCELLNSLPKIIND